MAAMTTIALAAAAAGTIYTVSQANKAKKAKGADTATPDPALERAKAETDAAQRANSKLAQRNRSRVASSLQAKPVDTTTSGTQTLGGAPTGKSTLGG